MRTKVALSSLLFICLFLGMSVKAIGPVYIDSINYSGTVPQGEDIEIEVVYQYDWDLQKLSRVVLQYSINSDTVDQSSEATLEEFYPASVWFYSHASHMQVGDIYHFRIYTVYEMISTGATSSSHSDIYTIIITEVTETVSDETTKTGIINESLPSIYIPLIVLGSLVALATIIVKIKK